jgi:N-acetylglucosaminyl-diphospho-decaprenol L-rhamnosyltransferase
MKLLVVIVSYRVTDLTIDCLRSLAGRIGRVPGARVAVLENGTGGDAYEQLRRAIHENGWGSWVTLSATHPNRGFCGGNNLLLRAALDSDDRPEYLHLLNADTLMNDGAIEALVEFMDAHPRAGIASSKTVWPDGEVQGPPFRFPSVATELEGAARLGLLSKILPSVVVRPKPTTSTRVDWVAGASMILRRTMLEQIGLLDEGLYTYFDDVDICLRAHRAGWETWYVPESVVTHLEGRSTGVATGVVRRRPSYWFQARRRFHLRSYGALHTAIVDAAFIVGFASWRLRRWATARPDPDPEHMLGDFVRHSVWVTGFGVREVENPALAAVAAVDGDPAGARAATSGDPSR